MTRLLGGRFRRVPGARPLVLGHRGSPERAPENTLSSFQLAQQEGADGFEFDVRLDGSGEVVVFHDRTLTRMSGERSRARVDRVPTSALKQIELGSGERIPLLLEVLELGRAHDLCLNVELKASPGSRRKLVARVAEQLRDEPRGPERLLLSCFDPWVVWWLSHTLPGFAVAWLVHDQQRLFKYGVGRGLLGAAGINPQHTLLEPARVERWKRGGGLVNTWTVNDPVRAREYAELGVDSIISDVPGKILAALA
ncbi:MAG: glycerophosphodiester phosphodiesterase [Myxococcota bacterium]|jgi:glycerophosphoryl diester phosphodiesterase|nr:glycerophosphodiester phosphodiesterase [Myxococcota bacterium]